MDYVANNRECYLLLTKELAKYFMKSDNWRDIFKINNILNFRFLLTLLDSIFINISITNIFISEITFFKKFEFKNEYFYYRS
jgi:hypothetical protein